MCVADMESHQDLEWDVAAHVEIPAETAARSTGGARQEAATKTAGFGIAVNELDPISGILDRQPDLYNVFDQLVKQPLAKSTVAGYANHVNKFKHFCAEQNYEAERVTEQALLHYLGQLVKLGTTVATLHQTKPALELYVKLVMGSTEVFTERVQVLWESAERNAALVRPPVKKAPQAPLQLLRDIVNRYAAPFYDNPMGADPVKLRTVARIVIIYFTACRGADYRELQAKHLEWVDNDIMVTFPKTKTDQLHNSERTLLQARVGALCPVKVLVTYLHRLGIRIGAGAGDQTYLHARIRKVAGRGYVPEAQGSMSLAREGLEKILVEMGLGKKAATDKTFKMLTVTEMLEAGVPVEVVALHGRWRTQDIVLRYKHNSVAFKRYTASLVPV